MLRRLTTRPIAIAAGVLLAGAVVAFAAWSVQGSGSGAAKAATAADLTLTSGTPAGAIYPGGTADVATSIANGNPFPVHVSSIVLDTSRGSNGFAVDAGHSGCDLSTLSLPAQTNGGSGWDVAAGGSLAVDLSGALAMSSAAGDACQGASFTVYLTVSGASS